MSKIFILGLCSYAFYMVYTHMDHPVQEEFHSFDLLQEELCEDENIDEQQDYLASLNISLDTQKNLEAIFKDYIPKNSLQSAN